MLWTVTTTHPAQSTKAAVMSSLLTRSGARHSTAMLAAKRIDYHQTLGIFVTKMYSKTATKPVLRQANEDGSGGLA